MADFKELRKKQGLTQAQLADILDVSVNTVQNWERGRNLPSGENLNKYLKINSNKCVILILVFNSRINPKLNCSI